MAQPTDVVCDVDERNKRHAEALTTWLNYLLRDECDDDESFHETAARNKNDADRHLRELLAAGPNARSNVKAVESQPNKQTGFNFKTFFADARMTAIRSR
ncbi:unnamed protein product [Anisakis simplex]|uniref:Uncharacterized protein n=1 Tax=Anisakis simplex TaxID=6269 RepID=A0A3P6PPH9_ANISI|nr:unnamed protein product [Anisakis simplex]